MLCNKLFLGHASRKVKTSICQNQGINVTESWLHPHNISIIQLETTWEHCKTTSIYLPKSWTWQKTTSFNCATQQHVKRHAFARRYMLDTHDKGQQLPVFLSVFLAWHLLFLGYFTRSCLAHKLNLTIGRSIQDLSVFFLLLFFPRKSTIYKILCLCPIARSANFGPKMKPETIHPIRGNNHRSSYFALLRHSPGKFALTAITQSFVANISNTKHTTNAFLDYTV